VSLSTLGSDAPVLRHAGRGAVDESRRRSDVGPGRVGHFAFRDHISCRRPTRTRTAVRCRLCRNGTQHRLPVRRRWIDVAGTVWAAHAPSSRTWSFPPRPDTHHVRWIEPSRTHPGEVFVAIEAGALVRTRDGGQTWLDRAPGGPIDTHTAATHLLAPNRVYSAAGMGISRALTQGTAGRVASMACSIGTSSGSQSIPRIRTP